METKRAKLLIDGALFLSLTAALLYFGGRAYVSAYFAGLGLRGYAPSYSLESMMASGADVALIGGLLVGLRALLFAEVLILVAFIAAIVSSINRVNSIVESFARFRAESAAKPKTRLEARTDAIFDLSSRFFKPFTLTFALVAILVGFVVLAEKQGKDSARNVRNRFIETGIGLRTLHFSNGRSVMVGPLLACNQRVCLYLANNGVLGVRPELILSESISDRSVLGAP